MLTIITGSPGAGKTLLTLQRLQKEFIPEKGQAARPLYVNGVPDLDYRYFGARELVDPDKWYELPEGSIVFIDEAQRVFPQRPASIPVPEKCQQMATHRHRGMDLFITTQDATNIDTFVRKMCGRHLHVHRLLNRGAATVYEYDHWESSPAGYHEKKAAISVSAWKYPKKLYERYRSATIHTHKARFPLKLLILPLAVLMTVYGFWKIYQNFGGEESNVKQAFAEAVEPGPVQQAFSSPGAGSDVPVYHSAAAYLAQFVPVVPGLQHSAPAYQSVYEVRSAPKPWCIIYEGEGLLGANTVCACYTQQVTQYQTSDENCRYWARRGFFDHSLADAYEQASATGGESPGAPGSRYSGSRLARDR